MCSLQLVSIHVAELARTTTMYSIKNSPGIVEYSIYYIVLIKRYPEKPGSTGCQARSAESRYHSVSDSVHMRPPFAQLERLRGSDAYAPWGVRGVHVSPRLAV